MDPFGQMSLRDRAAVGSLDSDGALRALVDRLFAAARVFTRVRVDHHDRARLEGLGEDARMLFERAPVVVAAEDPVALDSVCAGILDRLRSRNGLPPIEEDGGVPVYLKTAFISRIFPFSPDLVVVDSHVRPV